MQYNTQQKRMPLPEYGRSIQNMVDHALTIEDRAERQRVAEQFPPAGAIPGVRATANNGKLRAVKQGEAAADQQRAGVISDRL